MDVLLICSAPDPREEPEFAKTADYVAIREAVRGLCAWAAANGGNLHLRPNPAVEALVRMLVPSDRWFLVGDLTTLMRVDIPVRGAILLGGGGAELELAREAHAAGMRMLPVATTGGAASTYLEANADPDANSGLTPAERDMLARDLAYGPLFEKLLSS